MLEGTLQGKTGVGCRVQGLWPALHLCARCLFVYKQSCSYTHLLCKTTKVARKEEKKKYPPPTLLL